VGSISQSFSFYGEFFYVKWVPHAKVIKNLKNQQKVPTHPSFLAQPRPPEPPPVNPAPPARTTMACREQRQHKPLRREGPRNHQFPYILCLPNCRRLFYIADVAPFSTEQRHSVIPFSTTSAMPPPSTPSSVASFTLSSGPHHDAIAGAATPRWPSSGIQDITIVAPLPCGSGLGDPGHHVED
jgi:hypothetical protein